MNKQQAFDAVDELTPDELIEVALEMGLIDEDEEDLQELDESGGDLILLRAVVRQELEEQAAMSAWEDRISY